MWRAERNDEDQAKGPTRSISKRVSAPATEMAWTMTSRPTVSVVAQRHLVHDAGERATDDGRQPEQP